MRFANLGFEAVLGKRADDPIDQIGAIRFIGDMLELAAAAFREMAAWRLLVVWAGLDRAVIAQQVARRGERRVAPAGGHAFAARRDPNNRLAHRQSAKACGSASIKSSAI